MELNICLSAVDVSGLHWSESTEEQAEATKIKFTKQNKQTTNKAHNSKLRASKTQK